ncbi:hypothetical protein FKM82_001969 [Ascaphus truei]
MTVLQIAEMNAAFLIISNCWKVVLCLFWFLFLPRRTDGAAGKCEIRMNTAFKFEKIFIFHDIQYLCERNAEALLQNLTRLLPVVKSLLA